MKGMTLLELILELIIVLGLGCFILSSVYVMAKNERNSMPDNIYTTDNILQLNTVSGVKYVQKCNIKSIQVLGDYGLVLEDDKLIFKSEDSRNTYLNALLYDLKKYCKGV